MQDGSGAEEKDTVTFAEPREFAPQSDEESFVEEGPDTLVSPASAADNASALPVTRRAHSLPPQNQVADEAAVSGAPPIAFVGAAVVVLGGLVGAAIYLA